MIVDVSRNDLSRFAKKGTVKVDELFGVYSFKQVHQMISTVSCEVEDKIELEEILKATFPPASMTGGSKDQSNGDHRGNRKFQKRNVFRCGRIRFSRRRF